LTFKMKIKILQILLKNKKEFFLSRVISLFYLFKFNSFGLHSMLHSFY